MAITGVGFDGTLIESDWSKIAGPHGVPDQSVGDASSTDWAVSPSGTVLSATVAPGLYNRHGVLSRSTAVETVTFANPGSGSRWDAVCLLINWTTNTVTLVVVQGTASMVVPWANMQKVPGTQCHVPLALVQLTAGSAAPTGLLDLREGVWVDVPIMAPFVQVSAADRLRRKIADGQVHVQGRANWPSGPLNSAIGQLPVPARVPQTIGVVTHSETFGFGPLKINTSGQVYTEAGLGEWTPSGAAYLDMYGSYWLN